MNTGPLVVSPEQAVQQIRAELMTYLADRQDKPSGWQEAAKKALDEFKLTFPLAGEPNAKPFTLDELKYHVINQLAPNFVVALKSMFFMHGSSTLRTKLEDTANSWPTQKDYELALAQYQKDQAQQEAQSLRAGKEQVEREKQAVEEAAKKLKEEKTAAEEAKKRLEEERQAAISEKDSTKTELLQLVNLKLELEEKLAKLQADNQKQAEGHEAGVANLIERIEGLRLLNTQLVTRLQQQPANTVAEAPNQAAVQQQSRANRGRGKKNH